MYERVIIDDETEETGLEKVDYRIIDNRLAVKADLLLLETKPLSFSIFHKGPYEKGLLTRCKKRWREEMKASVPNWTRKSDYYTGKVVIW